MTCETSIRHPYWLQYINKIFLIFLIFLIISNIEEGWSFKLCDEGIDRHLVAAYYTMNACFLHCFFSN